MEDEHIKCFWSNQDDAYIATPVEHPSITAFGDTKEEAYRELCIVLIACWESEKDHGKIKEEIYVPVPHKNRRKVKVKVNQRYKMKPNVIIDDSGEDC